MRQINRWGIALGMTAASLGASAQSNVQVYGVADSGVLTYHAGKSSGTRVTSGIGATSRLGFMGQEAIDSDLSVAFQFESGLKMESGVVGGSTAQGETAYFNRQSNVSLKSKEWGEIKMGRQLPAQVNTNIDPFAGVTGFSPYASIVSMGSDQGAKASIGDSRIGRALSYTTPDRLPLGGQLLVATRDSTDPTFPRLSAYGAELHYATGPWYFQGQYMANNTDPTATVPTFRNDWWGVATQYKFDKFTASYIGHALKPQRAGYLNSYTHVFGLVVPVGADNIKVSAVYRDVKTRSDLNTTALGLGYDKNFSKRTTAYVRLGYVDNRKNALGTLAGATLGAPGDNLSVVAIGIYNRF